MHVDTGALRVKATKAFHFTTKALKVESIGPVLIAVVKHSKNFLLTGTIATVLPYKLCSPLKMFSSVSSSHHNRLIIIIVACTQTSTSILGDVCVQATIN